MNYLYHRVPEDMEGDTLYPLNKLKEIYPNVYDQKIKKYDGREFIMDREIPYLNCRWNDVLHLIAVPPEEIKNSLSKAGFKTSSSMSWYKINPKLIEPENAVVYLYKITGKSADKMNKDNFISFNPKNIEQLSHIPKETRRYYQEMFEENQRPLLFVRIPHILYKGTLDTTDLSVEVV